MLTERKKLMFVSDVMLSKNRFAVLNESVMLKDALDAMSSSRLGVACIVDSQGYLKGVLTDGDIRRRLLSVQKPLSALFVDDAIEHAALTPVTVSATQSLQAAVRLMGEKAVWDLPVVDADGVLVGLLHLHPAIEALLGVESV